MNLTDSLKSNITKYYILRVLSKRIVIPIVTIYLLRNDLSISQITLLASVASLITVIFEVPSGVVADTIGLKRALFLTFSLWLISMVMYTIGGGFIVFLIGAVLYALGGTLYSGTHSAFLYETLEGLGKTNNYKKFSGKAITLSQASSFIFLLLIPTIADWNMLIPFIINILFFLLGVIVALSLTDVGQVYHHKGLVLFDVFNPNKLLEALHLVKSNRVLLYTILFFALLRATEYLVADFRQIYLKEIGLELFLFGLIYSCLRLLTGAFAWLAHPIDEIFGAKKSLALMIIITLVTLLGIAIVRSLWGVAFAMITGMVTGLQNPVEEEQINKFGKSSNRVTLLSLQVLTASGIHLLIAPLAGILTDWSSLGTSFLVLSIFIPFVLFGLMIKIFNTQPSVEETVNKKNE